MSILMKLIIDTREQKINHILSHFREIGQEYEVKKLDFGDYSIKGFESDFAIERKNGSVRYGGGWQELKGNICTKAGRVRFIDEFDRALNSGAEMVLLIENTHSIDGILNMKVSLTALNYVPTVVYHNMFVNFLKEQNAKRTAKGLNEIKLVFSENLNTGKTIIDLCKNYLK